MPYLRFAAARAHASEAESCSEPASGFSLTLRTMIELHRGGYRIALNPKARDYANLAHSVYPVPVAIALGGGSPVLPSKSTKAGRLLLDQGGYSTRRVGSRIRPARLR